MPQSRSLNILVSLLQLQSSKCLLHTLLRCVFSCTEGLSHACNHCIFYYFKSEMNNYSVCYCASFLSMLLIFHSMFSHLFSEDTISSREKGGNLIPNRSTENKIPEKGTRQSCHISEDYSLHLERDCKLGVKCKRCILIQIYPFYSFSIFLFEFRNTLFTEKQALIFIIASYPYYLNISSYKSRGLTLFTWIQ